MFNKTSERNVNVIVGLHVTDLNLFTMCFHNRRIVNNNINPALTVIHFIIVFAFNYLSLFACSQTIGV